METRRQENKRREFPRYQTMDRALTMVSQPPANTPYHIIDISRGGLAFRYLGEKMKDNKIAELDLYYNDTLCVKGVPVTNVADCWAGSDITDIRRSCISFKDLTAEQEEQLDIFIKNYSLERPQ